MLCLPIGREIQTGFDEQSYDIYGKSMVLSTRANRALIIKLIAAATTYGFSILLARTMPASEFGKVVLFLNAALMLSVVGARGQQIAALRFIPPLVQNCDRRGQIVFLRHLFRIALPTTLVLFALALIGAVITQQTGGLSEHSLAQLFLGLSLIPLVGWVDLQSCIARGYHMVQLSLIPKEILWRGATAVIVILIFLFGDLTPINANAVLLVLLLTLFIVGLGQTLWLVRKIDLPAKLPIMKQDTPREWHTTTNPFWISSVSNIFLANADVAMVGIFAGPTAAGYYFAANRLAMLLAFFLTSYNVVLGPMLAEAWHGAKPQTTENLIHNATLKTTAPTVLLGLVLAGLAPQILSLFGPEFTTATTPLRILLLAGVINAASGPAHIAMSMYSFQRQEMFAGAASHTTSAVFLFLGALYGGASGIALAVLLGTVLRKSMFWHLAKKHMSIRTDIFASWEQGPQQSPASEL